MVSECRWLILRRLCTVVLFQVSEKKDAVCKLIQIHKQQDRARESLLSSLASLYCQNRTFLMSDIQKMKVIRMQHSQKPNNNNQLELTARA